MQCPTCDSWFTGTSCDCGYVLPKRGTTPHRCTEHVLPEQGLDMESALGQPLHDALIAIGNITTLRVQLGRAAMGEIPRRIVVDCQQKEATAIGMLRASLLKLQADQVTELVQKYPWVAAC
ncbi:MAG: hypothetical protein H8K09_13315 [Nitrospira sp.]|nr:hypothetical protein [Nitrospira sp.]